ncbi:MAG: SDR family NAD(P)-dependent oxidoreductase [Betaproteobacteria bacterium]|jgi:NAD(P)-dependent dehydrogenase (short-subunit alcohol dehydrogenase family)
MAQSSHLPLAGKTILVTGASSGLGEHFCSMLKSQGARVIGLARRPLPATSVDVAIQADITDSKSVHQALDQALGKPGSKETIYGLVNNAGIAVTAPLHETSPEEEQRVLLTNISGITTMTREIVPHLKAAGGGVIVNIASVLGIRPLKRAAIYSASKAAVIQMTRSSAIELVKDKIRVNALAPGYVRTALNADVMDGPAGEALLRKIPLGRSADLSELNAPLLCLLDPSNTYMTGAVLLVDGGMSAGL